MLIHANTNSSYNISTYEGVLKMNVKSFAGP